MTSARSAAALLALCITATACRSRQASTHGAPPPPALARELRSVGATGPDFLRSVGLTEAENRLVAALRDPSATDAVALTEAMANLTNAIGDAGVIAFGRGDIAVQRLGWSSDGTVLYVLGVDHALRLWNVVRSREIAGVDDVVGVEISPDGTRLVAIRETRAPLLIDLRTGAALAMLGRPRRPARAVAFCGPHGDSIVVAADGDVPGVYASTDGSVRVSRDRLPPTAADRRQGDQAFNRRMPRHRDDWMAPLPDPPLLACSLDGQSVAWTEVWIHGAMPTLWNLSTGRYLGGINADDPRIRPERQCRSCVWRARHEGTQLVITRPRGNEVPPGPDDEVTRLPVSDPDTEILANRAGTRAVTHGAAPSASVLWELPSARRLATFFGNTPQFASNEQTLFTETPELLFVWNTDTGALVGSVSHLPGAVLAARPGSDDSALAFVERTGALTLWDQIRAERGAVIPALASVGLAPMAWSPDGRHVAISGALGAQVTVLPRGYGGGAASPCTIAPVDADEEQSTGAAMVSVRGLRDGALHRYAQDDGHELPPIAGRAVMVDGTRALVDRGNDQLEAWDIRAGRMITPVRGVTGYATDAYFVLHDTRILVQSFDPSALVTNPWSFSLHDGLTGARIARWLQSPERPREPWIDPTESYVVLDGLHLYDLRTGAVRATANLWAHDYGAGRALGEVTEDGRTGVFELPSGRRISSIPATENVSFSPRGDRMITWQDSPFEARLYEVATGRLLTTLSDHIPDERDPDTFGELDDPGAVRDVINRSNDPKAVFSADGATVMVFAHAVVHVIDARSGGRIGSHRGVYLGSGSTNGRVQVLTLDVGGTIRLWDLANPREAIASVPLPGFAVSAGWVDPATLRVGLGYTDGTVIVVDPRAGRRLWSQRLHRHRVSGLLSSRGGERWVSVADSEDGIVYGPRGERVAVIPGGVAAPEGSPELAEISDDGSLAIVRTTAGTILAPTTRAGAVAFACRYLRATGRGPQVADVCSALPSL